MRRSLASLLAVFAVMGNAARAAKDFPTGAVIERVVCAAAPSQTYALYLPAGFNAGRKWPVLFCFDPGARGGTPVERFRAAAEKHGYIVAGSNNSRNGPWPANAAAIDAMMSDVHRRFPVDARRVYVTGMSGGARVACQVAVSGLARGVIACAATFMGSTAPAKVPFLFFGTAGVTDFNYVELRRVQRELDERRATHRAVIFEGGHEWLPAPLASEALAWLNLHAMRSGALAPDPAWIREQFDARVAAVPAAPVGERYLALKSIAADFEGLLDVTGLQQVVRGLAGSRELRDWLKQERANERRETALADTLLASVREGFSAAATKNAAALRARTAGADILERQIATRALHRVHAAIVDNAREAMRAEDYALAATLLETGTVLRPERPQLWLDLARARARLRDRRRALAALESAIAAGFNDTELLRVEPAFEWLRTDAGFQAVVGMAK